MSKKEREKKPKGPSAAKTTGLRAQVKALRQFVRNKNEQIEAFVFKYIQATESTLKSNAQSISNLNKVTMEAVIVVQLLIDKGVITGEEVSERRDELLAKQAESIEAASQETPDVDPKPVGLEV